MGVFVLGCQINMDDRDLIRELEGTAQRIVFTSLGSKQIWHVWNTGANQKLVLLHGGSGSWTHWVRNIRDLSKKFEVWALDIPGFGDSDLPPQAIDVDDLAPYVAEGLKQLGGGLKLSAMGFSFGGLLAGFVAAQAPSLISRLILVGVPALGLTGTPLSLRGLRPEMTELEVMGVYRHNLEVMMLADPNSINAGTLELQKQNVERDRLKRRRIARGDALLKLQRNWTCPVHAIWGELDALYVGRLTQAKASLENCQLESFDVIPSAGHWVQYEAPTEFNHCVENIFKNINLERS